jgi:hypothetical protein
MVLCEKNGCARQSLDASGLRLKAELPNNVWIFSVLPGA